MACSSGYYNTAEQLLPYLDVDRMLAFCQQYHVEVLRGEDWLYHGYIGVPPAARCWSAELDAFSALVMAVHNYARYQQAPLPADSGEKASTDWSLALSTKEEPPTDFTTTQQPQP